MQELKYCTDGDCASMVSMAMRHPSLKVNVPIKALSAQVTSSSLIDYFQFRTRDFQDLSQTPVPHAQTSPSSLPSIHQWTLNKQNTWRRRNHIKFTQLSCTDLLLHPLQKCTHSLIPALVLHSSTILQLLRSLANYNNKPHHRHHTMKLSTIFLALATAVLAIAAPEIVKRADCKRCEDMYDSCAHVSPRIST